MLVTSTPPNFFLHLSLCFWDTLYIGKKYSNHDSFGDMAFMIRPLINAKKIVYGISPLNMWDFLSVGILHAPTLFWVRNLKGRNIRPNPIKLGRICMHQEKSGHVIFSYHVIWSKQKIIWTKTQTTHLLFNLAVMHFNKT